MVRHNTLTKPQYQAICLGYTRHVRPHFLVRFDHHTACQGVPHLNSRNSASFYTDASKTKGGTGISIYCSSCKRLSISEPVDPRSVTDNTEAEIIALATAVTAFDKGAIQTDIYCDSTAAIDAVTKPQQKRHRNPVSLEVVSLAQQIIQESEQKIRIHHVYSPLWMSTVLPRYLLCIKTHNGAPVGGVKKTLRLLLLPSFLRSYLLHLFSKLFQLLLCFDLELFLLSARATTSATHA